VKASVTLVFLLIAAAIVPTTRPDWLPLSTGARQVSASCAEAHQPRLLPCETVDAVGGGMIDLSSRFGAFMDAPERTERYARVSQSGRGSRDDGAAARSDALMGTPNKQTPVPQTNLFSTSPRLEQQAPAPPAVAVPSGNTRGATTAPPGTPR
jgi:hypothetical protein